MRIAVVHNLQRGGAHRRLTEQLERLDGDAVEVCLGTAAPVTDDPIVVPYRPLAPLVPRVLRPPLRYADLTRLAVAWAQVARRVSRLGPDVVWANPCRFLQTPAALLFTGRPSVYHCDEPRRIDYEPEARGLLRNPRTQGLYRALYALERRLDRGAVERATRLTTNSGYSAEQIRSAYAREATVVAPGVSELMAPPSAPIAPRHLLSVGTLIPTKGHELAIEAVARARRRWPLLVVAPRPDAGEQRRLGEIASRRGVPLEIRIGISDEELRDAYRAALATLYLSMREPYGLVSLEAQACGTPVVVADEGGLPETILNGQTGWAEARADSTRVAHRIDELGDPEVRTRMGARAARHARAASWQASAAALRREMEDACASRS